jgi:hypothetical protein
VLQVKDKKATGGDSLTPDQWYGFLCTSITKKLFYGKI